MIFNGRIIYDVSSEYNGQIIITLIIMAIAMMSKPQFIHFVSYIFEIHNTTMYGIHTRYRMNLIVLILLIEFCYLMSTEITMIRI